MYRISALNTRKDLIKDAAKLAYGEWFLNRKIPLNIVELEYERRSSITSLPITIIATLKSDNSLAGMVTIKNTELSKWQFIGPWLSALYVVEEHRNNGVAEKLLNSALRHTASMGFPRVYLFIDPKNFNKLKRFYTRKGWIYLDSTIDEDGHDTEIFFKELKGLPQIITDKK